MLQFTLSHGKVKMEETETESWNGKLKQRAETEKLKIGSGRQKYKWYWARSIFDIWLCIIKVYVLFVPYSLCEDLVKHPSVI